MSDSRIDWWPPIEGTPPSTNGAGGGAGTPQPPAQPPRRSRARERERMAREKSHSRRNAILAIVVCVLLLAGAIYVAWSVFGGHGKDTGNGSAAGAGALSDGTRNQPLSSIESSANAVSGLRR